MDNVWALISLLSFDEVKKIDWKVFHWNEILALSHVHGIDGFVWGKISELQSNGVLNLSLEDKVNWYGTICKIRERNLEIKATINKLRVLFDEAEVWWLVLKGVSCAQYYESEAYRPMGDVDVFVGRNNYARAKEVLRRCEENVRWGHEDARHVVVFIDDVVVELHREWELRTECREDMIIPMPGMTKVYCLSREYNVVYVFAHLYRHFIGGGITLRQIMDWIIMLRAEGDFDEHKVMDMIRYERLESQWNAIGWMVKRYLGVDVIGIKRKENKKLSEGILHLILESPLGECRRCEDGLSRIGRLLKTYKRYFRAWKLVPADCLCYWSRLALNNIKGVC